LAEIVDISPVLTALSYVLKDSVMKRLLRLLVFFMIVASLNCSEETDKNMVPIDQLNIDNSNNYRFIFRETIEKENWRANRYKKDEFQE
jgi:hypothetical protein